MNRLEYLIQKFCPNGVEYVKIGEIVNYEQPSKYIVRSTDYNDDFSVPVLTAGQSFILGYTNEEDGHYKATHDNPVIILDDFTGAFKWVDFEFKVKSSAMKMLTADEAKATTRYIYHLMGKLNFTSSEHKRLWIGTYSEFLVPVPPLPVQEEIVRILDSFTQLTTELQAELQARKKQYEYYLSKLYQDNSQYEKVKLKDLCQIGDGLHGTPQYAETGTHYFINGNNLSSGKIICDNKTKRINQSEYERLKIEFDNTIFMSINGTIGNMALYCGEEVSLGKSVAYFNIISDNIDKSYLYYYLQTFSAKAYFESNLTGSTIKNLGLKAIREHAIPLPPIECQKKISSIISDFDTLCNDLTTGLPAEIAARQKQCEYYRDKLLAFKELGA